MNDCLAFVIWEEEDETVADYSIQIYRQLLLQPIP